MLNIAICDDEKICLEEAKRAIQRYAKENNVSISLFTFDDGDSLIDSHKREPFDMVFLDIIMPLFNGMDLAHEIRENDSSVKIVFFTSSTDFAVESYDVKASGYLIKPIIYDKLAQVLTSCIKTKETSPANIILKTAGRYDKVYYHTIDYIEAQNKKVLFKLIDGTIIESTHTFSYFTDKLTIKYGFFKCHRSYIVYIPNVNHFSAHEIITVTGVHIPVS